VNKFLTLLALSFLFSSCFNCIEGIGEPVADKRAQPQFSEVQNNSAIDIELIFDSNEAYNHVIVKAPENLQTIVETIVDGDELQISTAECYRSSDPIVVEVHCNKLEAIDLSGSGDLRAVETVKTGKLSIDQSGSGDVEIGVKTADLELDRSGSGSIEIYGKAEYFEIEQSGSGSFKGEDLKVDYAEIDNSGSGDVELAVRSSIQVKNSGSGDVLYSGKPKDREIQASGSGKVEQN